MLPLVGHDEEVARSLLGRFLFSADDVQKRVDSLSGGERSRLRLLVLLTGDANFLLLDEPTNHLDVDSVEALAAALADYTGTVLLITHDRHLIDSVATRVLEIHEGTLLNHLSVDRYWEARAARRPAAEEAGAAPAPAAGAGAAARRAGRRGTRRRRRQPPRAPPGRPPPRRRAAGAPACAALEADILKLERRLGQIDAELAEPETYADRRRPAELADERASVDAALQQLYVKWEAAVDESP